jgi:hypothetical protein
VALRPSVYQYTMLHVSAPSAIPPSRRRRLPTFRGEHSLFQKGKSLLAKAKLRRRSRGRLPRAACCSSVSRSGRSAYRIYAAADHSAEVGRVVWPSLRRYPAEVSRPLCRDLLVDLRRSRAAGYV